MMQRRGFLGAILAAGVAPAYVGSGVLMPVKSLYIPSVIEFTTVDEAMLGAGIRSKPTASYTRNGNIITVHMSITTAAFPLEIRGLPYRA